MTKLLTMDLLHDYQKRAVRFQCSKKSSALWLFMGAGKTIITLTSIKHLIDTGYLSSVLVVAPLRVMRMVWKQEALKWEHTKDLRFSMIGGTRDQRNRALTREADIYLINYENLQWLADLLKRNYTKKKGKVLPFDGVVWDELSKAKNSTSKRVKAMLPIIDTMKWRTGLTGTPASNGVKDLHGQFLVLDSGERLGRGKTRFQDTYFTKSGPFKIELKSGADDLIKEAIADITLEMSQEDYLKLPDMIVNDIVVDLPIDIRQAYDELEKNFFLSMDSMDEDIEVFNKASLTNKLLQFSNGFVYPVAGLPVWERIHDAKLEALDEIVEESGDEPLLISYAYKADAIRIMDRYKDLKPINLTQCKSQKELESAMNKWHTGECKMMIGHSASIGHGLDSLQDKGSTLVWFGLNWSLDLYEQFNARIRRQGQSKPVTCHRIVCRDTMDDAQILALESKAIEQNDIRKAIKDYRKQRGL